MWHREPGFDLREVVFTLIARVGSYVLAVVLEPNGRVRWSVGEGDLGEYDSVERLASDAEAAKRAAITEARRRWQRAGRDLDELEREIDTGRDPVCDIDKIIKLKRFDN